MLNQGGSCSEIASRSGSLQGSVDNLSFICKKGSLATASILSHKCTVVYVSLCVFQSMGIAE